MTLKGLLLRLYSRLGYIIIIVGLTIYLLALLGLVDVAPTS